MKIDFIHIHTYNIFASDYLLRSYIYIHIIQDISDKYRYLIWTLYRNDI